MDLHCSRIFRDCFQVMRQVKLADSGIFLNHETHKLTRKKFMERTHMQAINANAMNFFRTTIAPILFF